MRSKRQVLALFGIVLLMSAGVARADVYQINFDTLRSDDGIQQRSDSRRDRRTGPV